MAEGWDWRDDQVPRIDGKFAIVTGAASGLGAFIAEACEAANACSWWEEYQELR